MRIKLLSTKSRFSRSTFGNVLNLFALLVLAALMSLPLMYTIANAFKPLNELFLFPPKIFPRNPTLDNFQGLSSVFRQSLVPLSRYVLNSLFITVAGVFGQIVFASLAAYVLSKEDFPGRKLLNDVVVLSLLFSADALGVVSYTIFSKLGLLNTHASIILPAFCSSLGLFLMKQFMDQTVPNTLLEAGRIDGATDFQLFSKIAMPLCKPAWLTLIIFSFVPLWNSPGGTIYSEELKTLPKALNMILSGGLARAGVSMAVGLILIIPPIITFVISQSNIIETMSTSGMKD